MVRRLIARGANALLQPLGLQLRQLRDARGVDTFHDVSDADRETYRLVSPYTMTSAARIYALCEAVRFLLRTEIHGAFVECGVWRGGSAMAMALTCRAHGVLRPLHLFDTFEGMPVSSERDVEIGSGRTAEQLRAVHSDAEGRWVVATQEEVRANMTAAGIDMGAVHLHAGMVEDTIPAAAPDHIALLRLDTDWYASTRHELQHLWPRLAVGGVLIVDDYGHFSGARDAVDEYFATRPVLLQRIDYTGRLIIKTRHDH